MAHQDDKDLLYYFEKGELLRAKGDLTGSQTAWRKHYPAAPANQPPPSPLSWPAHHQAPPASQQLW